MCPNPAAVRVFRNCASKPAGSESLVARCSPGFDGDHLKTRGALKTWHNLAVSSVSSGMKTYILFKLAKTTFLACTGNAFAAGWIWVGANIIMVCIWVCGYTYTYVTAIDVFHGDLFVFEFRSQLVNVKPGYTLDTLVFANKQTKERVRLACFFENQTEKQLDQLAFLFYNAKEKPDWLLFWRNKKPKASFF